MLPLTEMKRLFLLEEVLTLTSTFHWLRGPVKTLSAPCIHRTNTIMTRYTYFVWVMGGATYYPPTSRSGTSPLRAPQTGGFMEGKDKDGDWWLLPRTPSSTHRAERSKARVSTALSQCLTIQHITIQGKGRHNKH